MRLLNLVLLIAFYLPLSTCRVHNRREDFAQVKQRISNYQSEYQGPNSGQLAKYPNRQDSVSYLTSVADAIAIYNGLAQTTEAYALENGPLIVPR